MDRLGIYEILVKQNESMLLAYIHGFTQDFSTAEDIAQEAFVKAYEKLDQLKNKEAFSGWLRVIAKNLVFEHLQKSKKGIIFSNEIVEGYNQIFEAVEEMQGSNYEEKLSFLKECFAKLPDGIKDICRLHYFEEQKSKDIAANLQITLATVLKRLERGRANLRECVEKKLNLENI